MCHAAEAFWSPRLGRQPSMLRRMFNMSLSTTNTFHQRYTSSPVLSIKSSLDWASISSFLPVLDLPLAFVVVSQLQSGTCVLTFCLCAVFKWARSQTYKQTSSQLRSSKTIEAFSWHLQGRFLFLVADFCSHESTCTSPSQQPSSCPIDRMYIVEHKQTLTKVSDVLFYLLLPCPSGLCHVSRMVFVKIWFIVEVAFHRRAQY